MLRKQHPNEPWLWRRDWSERAVHDTRSVASGCLWAFAILWLMMTVPAYFIFTATGGSDPKKYFVALFPLAGVFLILTALYHTLRRRKYGLSICRIDRSPVPIGSTLRGELETRLRELPPAGLALRLACVRRMITGSGKNRSTHETVLWQDEQTIEHGMMPSPNGLRVPFRFDIPPDCEPADESNAEDMVVWRLDASAEVPGIDYAAQFELPIFRTGDAGDSGGFMHARITNPSSWMPPKEIAVEPTRIIVRSPGRIGDAIAYLLFFTAWFGALAFFRSFGAPLFVIAFFVAIGLLVVAIALDFLFGRSTIAVDYPSLTTRRLGRTRTIATADIERIEPRIGTTLGNRTYHDVHAILHSGRTQKIAKYIRNKRDADMLSAKVMRMLGR